MAKKNKTKKAPETREQKLVRLLKKTWECLPGVIAEDCVHETDIKGLAKIAAEVGDVLAVEWSNS
jgi:hypothetical protein